MGVIDWPTPYLSNNAFFKPTVTLPNGRGSTRRINIPEVESDVLGLQDRDRASVEMYDKNADRSIAFETQVTDRDGGPNLRFTIPLRKIDLEPNEFDSNSKPQVILRKTGLNRFFPQINPKRIYDIALFKTTAAIDFYEEQSTLRYNIPANQVRGIGLREGDSVNITMSRVNDGSAIEHIKDSLTTINRNAFRAELTDTTADRDRDKGTGTLSFHVKARFRRARDIDPDKVYQFAVALTSR